MKHNPRELTAFGKALMRYKVDNNLKMKQLAEICGCAATYLSNIAHGHFPVPGNWPYDTALPFAIRLAAAQAVAEQHHIRYERAMRFVKNLMRAGDHGQATGGTDQEHSRPPGSTNR